jgi:hypothetical protein
MLNRLVCLGVACLLLVAISGYRAESANDFVGAKKCKVCHSSEKMSGTHYKLWEESNHAKSFAVLATDAAKESAKKHGIEDPQKDEKCLSCHTTKAVLGATDEITLDEGISCEACHGAAEGYLKPHAKDGYDASVALGMVSLKKLTPEELAATCTRCHREDPLNDFYKPFNFDEAWAKIDHTKATSPKILEKRAQEAK